LEPPHAQAQAVPGCLVAQVGLVQGDVAEGGAGAGRGVAAQVEGVAVLVGSEAPGDAGPHLPALVQLVLQGQPDPRIERILVGLGAIARGALAGEPAAAEITAELPFPGFGGRGGGAEAAEQAGRRQQPRAPGGGSRAAGGGTGTGAGV